MDKIVIRGGKPLSGHVPITGAKNAALPILIATLVAPGEHRLSNVPDLVDVSSMLSLLGRIGCPSLKHGSDVRLDTTRVSFCEAPYDLVRKMRASVLALGPLLARCGEAHVSLPGGCAIGVRPIDQHLKGLEALGAEFELSGGYVHARTSGLRGAHIVLDVPTVTGTENILTAAVLARGESLIENAAREPEIIDLARFLRSLGAKIEGEGSGSIRVQGVHELKPAAEPHRILPDRIEAGTYMVAAAITGGDVTVTGVDPRDMGPVVEKLRAAGCLVELGTDRIRVQQSGDLLPVDVTTRPHPGFPTDMQAQLMALCTLAKGRSVITETIFENRFMHVPELARLGADIQVEGNRAVVTGVEGLHGATVMATDLRASASLVLAGLATEGPTEILRLYHLDRGYERLVEKLQAIGADVERVPDDLRDRIPTSLSATVA
ncbi:MAG: UDP-N-acetylglucosamine 1-carboxyvinyltransferase [Proteobacteria bacterium]|nr:UDP-N-acetylglucosamine 1-carboxyvinyltransferase [Pseudomonadota bacterium]MCP4917737.1 UDP-N-acetylglucosamine 1-carboxyvinyltransferase [Pseudomonadota bacterium]